jgi:hypothetical protein
MKEDIEVKRKALFDRALKEMNDEQFEFEQAILARYAKARFDQFVKAGFTPEQAIQLCK